MVVGAPVTDAARTWLRALWVQAMVSRGRVKPSIPLVGNYGIPLHDELELERVP